MMYKKIMNMLLTGITASMLLTGCGSSTQSSTTVSSEESYSDDRVEEPESTPVPAPASTPFSLKVSDDKHIAYISNYVGMNAANVGYTALNGTRRDHLGESTVLLEFVTDDGSYVGPDDEDNLKNYVVTAQNVKPNTEVHLTFSKDSDGNEYDSLVSFTDLDEIDLAVKKVGDPGNGPELVEITQSPDKYTNYIRNYVGKNLAAVGYESLGGDYRDKYGAGTIKLNIAPEDGSYIDYSDEGLLRQYVVTAQSIAPNTEFTYTFSKASDGTEYDSLIQSQTIDSVTLNVKTLTGEPAVPTATQQSEG